MGETPAVDSADPPGPPTPEVGERKRPGFLAGDAWLILDAVLLVPLMLFTLLAGPADPDAVPEVTDPAAFEALVVVSEVVTLVLFVGMPVAWLATTRVGGLRGAWAYLRMTPPTRRRWPFHLTVAVLAVPAAVGLAFAYGAFLAAIGEPGGDPFFQALAQTVSWPTLAMVAVVAGVGEEVLFRGILQRYVGVWGQAALFTALHVNQGFAVLPLIALAALAFGAVVKRGAPLWSVMVTHALYDLVLLGLVREGL